MSSRVLRLGQGVVLPVVVASILGSWLLTQHVGIDSDGTTYVAAARQLMSGRPPESVTYRPLYAFLLGLVLRTGIGPESAGQIVSLVFWIALVPLVCSLGRRLYGTETGIVAAWLISVYPGLSWQAGAVLTTTTYTFLLVGCVLCGWVAVAEARLWYFAVAGALSGLASLVRPEGVGVLVCALMAFIAVGGLQRWGRARWLRLCVGLVIVVASFGAVSVPYRSWARAHGASREGTVLDAVAFVDRVGGGAAYFEDKFAEERVSYDLPKPTTERREVDRRSVLSLGRKFASSAEKLYTEGLPSVFPPLLLMFAGVGLFLSSAEGRGMPWDRHCYVLCYVLPCLAVYAATLFMPRYLLPLCALMVPWCARGIVRTADEWSQRRRGLGEVGEDTIAHLGARYRFLLTALVVASLLPQTVKPVVTYPRVYEEIEAGHWIREHTPRAAVLMCRSHQLGFYAERKYIAIPWASEREILEHARKMKVDYFVVNEDKIPRLRPQLARLLDERNVPADWVKVQEVKGRPGRGIRLYRTPFAGEPAGRQAAPQGPPP